VSCIDSIPPFGGTRNTQIKSEFWRRSVSFGIDTGLQDKTHFDTPVRSVKRQGDQWVINDDPDTYGTFDGVVVAVGTCGDPKMPRLPKEEEYQGTICHSSELDRVQVEGKRVVIIGGSASAIEAVEYAIAKGAEQVDIVSRVSATVDAHVISGPRITATLTLILNRSPKMGSSPATSSSTSS
jgi:cation diffusion facilitator CzcD-associated flavoprotein CzcO